MPTPSSPCPRPLQTRSPNKVPYNYRVSKRPSKPTNHFRAKSVPDCLDRAVVVAKMTPLNGARPPSDEEAASYYYGLPSHPKLVARSSTTTWKLRNDSCPIGKIFSPVGLHPIVDMWNSTGPLQAEILQSLEGISWAAVDILRIGYERPHYGEDFPHVVTLFISVEPGSTSWPLGYAVVCKCRRILERCGIRDVEVDMKEGRICRSMSPATAPTNALQLSSSALDMPIDANALLSQFTGLSIATYDRPTCEGTKCLYLRCRDTQRVFLLTCRHVVLGDLPPDQDYQHNASNPKTVLQPGNSTLKKEKGDIKLQIYTCDEYINSLDNTRPGAAAKIEHEQSHKQKLLDTAEKLDSLAELDKRIIGHVVFSPKYGCGPTQLGKQRLRDWALIALHPEKHGAALMRLDNRIFVGENAVNKVRSAMLCEMKKEDYKACSARFDRDTHTVIPKDIVPENEMRRPEFDSVSLNMEAIIVAKHGRSTKLTIGVANEVKSVIRGPMEGGLYYVSEEWCILGHKPIGRRRDPFSEDGDSGSCVWDMKGRIGGMVTAGITTGADGTHDTSYATPMEWLLNDIREHGFNVELL